jgi:lipopolysaccharide/colanic/teichoic acid biosynthesis glycosyltransferase
MLAEAKIVETVNELMELESRGAGRLVPEPEHGDWTSLTERTWYPRVKFAGEWLIALTLLVLLSPLALVLALLVKATSRGPAFYLQTRLGRFGRRYRIVKLRTMVQDAEAGTGAVWASKDDVRITGIGRFLRATHLDEIPQLWNVVRGEMSLIGPRPERPEIARRIERRVPEFRQRLLVRPGITGLAQMICPADDPDDVEYRQLRMKLAHDLYYVRKVSFVLDLRVAFSTPCFFLAAAIDSMRRGLVRSYGRAVRTDLELQMAEQQGCERAA